MQPTADTKIYNSGSNHHVRRLIIWSGCFVGLVLALATVLLVGLYLWGWQNPVTNTLANFLSLPAGKAAGQTISYHDYLARLELVSLEQPGLNKEQAGQVAIRQLTDAVYINHYAAAHHLTANQTEVSQYTAVYNQLRSGQLKSKQLNQQASVVSLGSQIPQSLLHTAIGQQLADQQSVRLLQILSNALTSPPAVLGIPLGKFRTNVPVNQVLTTPLHNLSPSMQLAFGNLMPGQYTKQPVATDQGYFMAENVKSDTPGNPLIELAPVQLTLSQWLTYVEKQGVSSYVP